jgi:hypothetical protein
MMIAKAAMIFDVILSANARKNERVCDDDVMKITLISLKRCKTA